MARRRCADGFRRRKSADWSSVFRTALERGAVDPVCLRLRADHSSPPRASDGSVAHRAFAAKVKYRNHGTDPRLSQEILLKLKSESDPSKFERNNSGLLDICRERTSYCAARNR